MENYHTQHGIVETFIIECNVASYLQATFDNFDNAHYTVYELKSMIQSGEYNFGKLSNLDVLEPSGVTKKHSPLLVEVLADINLLI